jgi:dephospho-CoA kinase
MIVGLTGSFCAGKDTAAEYLVKTRGFVHHSLSDELRREMEARNIPTTRENLIVTGTSLREVEGNAVLAQRVLRRCPPDVNCIVTSIRHPAEINELRKRSDFILINLDAPARVRFERMRHRKRPGDPATFEKFVECEAKESQTKGSGQQLKECEKMADVTIMNDSTGEALHRKIDDVIDHFRHR